MEITLIFVHVFTYLCRRGNNHFDVHFRRIGPYLFPWKDGRDAAVREEMDGKCLFPARVGIPYFDI